MLPSDLSVILDFIKKYFPFDYVKNNPLEPLYVLMVCMIIGYLIINYKYLLKNYNKNYDSLSTPSKSFLWLVLGLILTFTTFLVFIFLQAVIDMYFKYALIDKPYGFLSYLLFSIGCGVHYFGNLRMSHKNKPFFDIAHFFSFSVLLTLISFFVLLPLSAYHELVYILPSRTGLLFIVVLIYKLLFGAITLYLVCRMIDSAYTDYTRYYSSNLLFHRTIKVYISKCNALFQKMRLLCILPFYFIKRYFRRWS